MNSQYASRHAHQRINPKSALKMAFVIVCLLNLNSVHASGQVSMMSSAYTNSTTEINLLNTLGKTNLPLKNQVKKLYELQNYSLIWSDGKQYNSKANQLLEIIQQADIHGFNPFEYDLDLINTFLEATSVDSNLISKSDIIFTHAYVKLASHISHGKLFDKKAILNPSNRLLAKLSTAIKDDTIKSTLTSLESRNSGYNNLLNALKKYSSLTQEQLFITPNKRSFSPGDRSPEISTLRKILYQLGDHTTDDLSSELFDEALADSLMQFQLRHGLETDGILGQQTLAEINKPASQRIQQLEINLARMQAIPSSHYERFILVNIPAYELYVYENDQMVFKTSIIVGKKKHETPLISSEIDKIILSPYWNVPHSIAKNEIIPELINDPGYLQKNNMHLYAKQNGHMHRIDENSINWANIEPSNFKHRIRQEPGNKNALGDIKFIFPNNHSVYLHDTPARNLFKQSRRALSHGCVRVENPFVLAEVLLAKDHALPESDIRYMAKQSKSKIITLKNPIPIHITYMTAWTDQNGKVHFRPDIYQRDRQLLAKLD